MIPPVVSPTVRSDAFSVLAKAPEAHRAIALFLMTPRPHAPQMRGAGGRFRPAGWACGGNRRDGTARTRRDRHADDQSEHEHGREHGAPPFHHEILLPSRRCASSGRPPSRAVGVPAGVSTEGPGVSPAGGRAARRPPRPSGPRRRRWPREAPAARVFMTTSSRREAQHAGRGGLLAGHRPHLGGATRHEPLGEREQRGIRSLVVDGFEHAVRDGAAVVHRAVEERAGEHESVERGHGERDRWPVRRPRAGRTRRPSSRARAGARRRGRSPSARPAACRRRPPRGGRRVRCRAARRARSRSVVWRSARRRMRRGAVVFARWSRC